MTPSRQPLRVGRVAACVSVATLSAWGGCASQAQTASVYRETAPAGSTEAAVREEFDPARLREDLLLIQPVFPPPSVVPVLAAPEPSRVETAATSFPVSVGGGADTGKNYSAGRRGGFRIGRHLEVAANLPQGPRNAA